MLARGTEFGECTSSSCQATKDQDIRRKSWIMKRNSKQFLALFMAVAMSVTPVSYAYAEDSAVAGVENTESGQPAEEGNGRESEESGRAESRRKCGNRECN